MFTARYALSPYITQIRFVFKGLIAIFTRYSHRYGAHRGTAGRGGRSRVRFPMVSLQVFIDVTLHPHCGPGIDSSSSRNEYQGISWGGGGLRRPVLRADNFTTFVCRSSWNLGAFILMEPAGPVQACIGKALPLTPTAILFISWLIWFHSSISQPSSWNPSFLHVSRLCSTVPHWVNRLAQLLVQ